MKNEFTDKKVLLIGLGILGGGVSIANWLVKAGAKLTITDTKPREYFADSIREIRDHATYIFGDCPEEIVKSADAIVLNQAVPQTNPLVLLAESLGKLIYNESKIFYGKCEKRIIAVTGTRGKTTTTNWIAHLLGDSALIAGNSPERALLSVLPKTKSAQCKIIVNEIPSFQLERFSAAPEIALITNIFIDHLSRHGTMENYALAKANVFKYQSANDKLILNEDNPWTAFFLKQNPKSEVWFFSMKKLPKQKNGIYYDAGSIWFKSAKTEKIVDAKNFAALWGEHNLTNLLSAMLAARLAGESWTNIKGRMKNLPQIRFRQELVAVHKKIDMVNDTAATSPEGGMAAVERFASPSCMLIAGGTDANLDYIEWGKTVAKKMQPENIILIAGSATQKMLAELGKYTDVAKITVKETLDECVGAAFEKISELEKPGTKAKDKLMILFSPAAKSFEKFKNEFDRGEAFNRIVKERMKK